MPPSFPPFSSARAQAPLLLTVACPSPLDKRGLKAWYGQAINFPSVWGVRIVGREGAGLGGRGAGKKPGGCL